MKVCPPLSVWPPIYLLSSGGPRHSYSHDHSAPLRAGGGKHNKTAKRKQHRKIIKKPQNQSKIKHQSNNVTNQLKIVSKSTSIEPTRNYVHTPIVIISENFDCIDQVIKIFFEEEVNIKYLLIKNTGKYKTYNKIKTYNIKAYWIVII